VTPVLTCSPALSFDLPDELGAALPAEVRGLGRDGVRMLVAGPPGAAGPTPLRDARAHDLPAVLSPGDLLVLNTSATLPAALHARTAAGESVAVHLSTVLPADGRTPAAALAATWSRWLVEFRVRTDVGTSPSHTDRCGDRVHLAGGGRLIVESSYPPGSDRSRLWVARLSTPAPLGEWLEANGEPIRYSYAGGRWPISAYRTTYAPTPGSAEMPSAGRALTPRLLTRLTERGVRIATLVLHCGVSSLEAHEPPYAEWYDVPADTAEAVARARRRGNRVVAVGTTVVRALETAAGQDGGVRAGSGWTDLVVTPERGVSAVDALLTGWHEPQASHLLMLEAVAGAKVLCESYRAALDAGYLWHEFGDLHLILRR
jgi:S-adenosylmethionine:tRNA ribosyltransferase-isomerase